MEDWSNKWLLRFHPEKCKVMNVSRKKSPNKRIYNMTNSQNNNIVELEQTEVEKDLGLNIDNSLTFEYHLNEKVNKANQIIGIIRISFHT